VLEGSPAAGTAAGTGLAGSLGGCGLGRGGRSPKREGPRPLPVPRGSGVAAMRPERPCWRGRLRSPRFGADLNRGAGESGLDARLRLASPVCLRAAVFSENGESRWRLGGGG